MPTIPTGKMERELKRLYMQWVNRLPHNQDNITAYVEQFKRDSIALVNRMGGDVARLGVVADFPAPRYLDLDLHVGTIYNDMVQAAIQAQIGTGLNPMDTVRALQKAGIDKSFSQLENVARTETVRAYWKNAWDSAEDLGLVMVWGAEHGPRTCAYCIAKDGLVVEDKDIRDHPRGRCTLLPMLPSRVPLRTKGINPKFQRTSWDGSVPQVVDQFLGRGLDHALVADRRTQTALAGMVSQGWTGREAGEWLLGQHQIDKTMIDAAGWSQVLRALENYADKLWAGLRRGSAPATMYRGGLPNATGLTSWTSSLDVARVYQLRNGGPVYSMTVPKQVYSYKLTNNPMQDEWLLLGSPGATTSTADGLLQGVFNGPTIMSGPPM